MKRPIRLALLTALLLLLNTGVQAQRRNALYNEYIRQYAPLAAEQMRQYSFKCP